MNVDQLTLIGSSTTAAIDSGRPIAATVGQIEEKIVPALPQGNGMGPASVILVAKIGMRFGSTSNAGVVSRT